MACLMVGALIAVPAAHATSCSLIACASASAGDGEGKGYHWAKVDLLGGHGQLYVTGGLADTCTFGIGERCSTSGSGLPGGCTVVEAQTYAWGGDFANDFDRYNCDANGITDPVSELVNQTRPLPP